jgi:hypothetical protein
MNNAVDIPTSLIEIPANLIDTKNLLDLFEKFNSVTYYAGGGGGRPSGGSTKCCAGGTITPIG